jgi:ABC transporter substrate binding protein (PQQ-dependent alcohol dehydrogenase system)
MALFRTVIVSGLILTLVSTLAMGEPLAIKIGYLGRAEKKATISLIDFPPENDGVAGVRLALEDNNTTGKFLNQHFSLEEVRIKEGDDPVAIVSQLADRGISLFIADLRADALLKVADAGWPRGLVFFNAGAIDDRLREEDCRPNVIHSAPTRSMLADALAQYLVVKRWRRWLLVVGSHDPDKLYADALRRAAARC